jgi:hypothetical protein
MRLRTLVLYLLGCLIAFVGLIGLSYHPSVAPVPPPVAPPPTVPPSLSLHHFPHTGRSSGGGGAGSSGGVPVSLPTVPELQYLSEIIPYLPFIGAVGAVWKYIKDWREQVVLGIDDIKVKMRSYYTGNAQLKEPLYCLRIQNRRRNGRAESCEGRIYVNGTDIDYSTVWADNNQRYIPISLVADLILFRISTLNNEKEIIFVVAQSPEGNDQTEIRKPFNEYANRKVSVRIGSANAHVPKHYIKTVNKIVQTTEGRI